MFTPDLQCIGYCIARLVSASPWYGMAYAHSVALNVIRLYRTVHFVTPRRFITTILHSVKRMYRAELCALHYITQVRCEKRHVMYTF